MRGKKRGLALLLCAALALALTGCKTREEPQATEEKKQIRRDVISMDGVELVPGETALSALYDIGFTVETAIGGAAEGTPEWRTAPFSKDMVLAADTTYQDFYLMKDGVKQARVDVSIGEACPLYDAVISAVYVDLSVTPTAEMTFGGVELDELTQQTFAGLFDGPVALDGAAAATYLGEAFEVDAQWNTSGELTKLCAMEIKQ